MMAEVITLTGLAALVVTLLYWARRRYPPARDPVVDAIDERLPQTQCAQCGYPGCRPYAEAVAAGAPLDLCPPGGADLQRQLAALLGRDEGAPLPDPEPVTARIDEDRCIGCFLCVEACPVDAIVGAHRFLHTVLEDRCTGCELCLAPCPVDCIELLPRPAPEPATTPPPQDEAGRCIRCSRCDAACPEALPVARLWWLSRGEDLAGAVSVGLHRCIECGLCNPACPSDLDLVGTFRAARLRLDRDERQRRAAQLARQHVAERQARLAREAERAAARRAARLAGLGKRSASP